jgi:hypothetical protein
MLQLRVGKPCAAVRRVGGARNFPACDRVAPRLPQPGAAAAEWQSGVAFSQAPYRARSPATGSTAGLAYLQAPATGARIPAASAGRPG